MIEINLVEANTEVRQFNRFERAVMFFAEKVLEPLFERARGWWLFAWLDDFLDVDSPINNPYSED